MAQGGEPHLSPAPRTPDETARVAAVTAPSPDSPEKFEALPGGATTPRGHSIRIITNGLAPSANLDDDAALDFITGQQVFERLWVSAPSSTHASDGLGPLYNARSCATCHPGGGRGAAPGEGIGTALRLSLPDLPDTDLAELSAYLEGQPEPTYGVQLQDRSISGVAAEGSMAVTYDPQEVTLADGTVVTLHAPRYAIADARYGAPDPDVLISARTAPTLIGMGLLDAIPEADILALADPDDADGDGISGRPNWVVSRAHGTVMLGRFGHKASEPTVLDQSAAAFHRDMGLSTRLYPNGAGECTEAQAACLDAPDGNTDRLDGVEVADAMLDLTVHYAANLAPERREGLDDPQVMRGKTLFHETRCTSCHTPKHVTHRLPDRPEHSFQLIWPMTDLLLHDMGEGLADHRREFGANGTEWRTAPLWGLGAREPERYLHDSRARSVLEAILWHGGEAAPHAAAVQQMTTEDRNALIAYLESL